MYKFLDKLDSMKIIFFKKLLKKLMEVYIKNVHLLSALGGLKTCPRQLPASQLGRALFRVAHDLSYMNISAERRSTEV